MENKPEKCATCKPLTNGDKIRGMTDEELVDVIGCPFGIDVDICYPRKTKKDDTWAKSGKRSQKDRSKTFPGIAAAMAEQWG